jgi:hypothetical protein
MKSTINHSDAVIVAQLSPSLTKFIESSGKPFSSQRLLSEAYSAFAMRCYKINFYFSVCIIIF